MKQLKLLVFLLCACLTARAVAQPIEDPFAEGRKFFDQQKYAEALEKFQKSLEYLPHDPTILSWIGAAYHNLGKYHDAELAMTEAIERGGTSYGFFELLAASQARQAEWDAALGTIARYRELEKQMLARGEEIGTEAERKEHQEKLRNLEAAIHLEKRLECLHREPPDHACADAELETAWQLHATDPTQYVSYTQIYSSKGLAEQDAARKAEDYSRAEAAARAWGATAAEADKVKTKIALSTVLVREKKFDDAIPVLQEIGRLQPGNCAAKLELARAYLGKEDFAQAKAVAAEAIACQPDETQAYLLRATAEYGLEDCPAVVKDGADYLKRAKGKEEPKFVAYCRNVLDSKRAAVDRQKQAEDYKRWIQQQLTEGDKAVEEALKPHRSGKQPDDKDKKDSKEKEPASKSSGNGQVAKDKDKKS